MFTNFYKSGQHPFMSIRTKVMNRCAATLAVGDLVAFDLAAGQAETAAGDGPGGTGILSIADATWANVIVPATLAVGTIQAYAVVSDLLAGAGADNTEIVVCVQGRCQAFTGANVAARGVALACNDTVASQNLIALAADILQRPIAYSESTGDGSSTETLINVMFFGLAGLFGGTADT